MAARPSLRGGASRDPRALALGAWLAVASASTIAARLAALPAPVPDDAGPRTGAVVTLASGRTLEGAVRVRDDGLVVIHQGRRISVPWADVARYRELDEAERRTRAATSPEALDELRARLRADTEAATDAAPLVLAANRAVEQGLPAEEARPAFERAIALDSANEGARRALGQALVDGEWLSGEALWSNRTARADDPGDFCEAAAWFERHGLEADRLRALCEALRRDNWFRPGLREYGEATAGHVLRSDLVFPLSGVWKGTEDDTRHHQMKVFAYWAIDYVQTDDAGRTHRGRGTRREDYFAWDQPVYAAGDGEVVRVEDGFPDNPIGTIADFERTNGCSIRHEGNEYSWYIHLKEGSLAVRAGDRVRRGQLLGRVGNSGASGRPHLHFAIVTDGLYSVPMWVREWSLVVEGREIPVERGLLREGQLVRGHPEDFFTPGEGASPGEGTGTGD